jgi:restriction endonuclease S subunit
MAGEWKESALGEVLELKRGYDLPQQQRHSGHVPIVSSSGITDYHAEAMVKGPGVVTGRYGTLGDVFYIPEDFWPLNTTLYVRDFKGNDPRFISYFLRSISSHIPTKPQCRVSIAMTCTQPVSGSPLTWQNSGPSPASLARGMTRSS